MSFDAVYFLPYSVYCCASMIVRGRAGVCAALSVSGGLSSAISRAEAVKNIHVRFDSFYRGASAHPRARRSAPSTQQSTAISHLRPRDPPPLTAPLHRTPRLPLVWRTRHRVARKPRYPVAPPESRQAGTPTYEAYTFTSIRGAPSPRREYCPNLAFSSALALALRRLHIDPSPPAQL